MQTQPVPLSTLLRPLLSHEPAWLKQLGTCCSRPAADDRHNSWVPSCLLYLAGCRWHARNHRMWNCGRCTSHSLVAGSHLSATHAQQKTIRPLCADPLPTLGCCISPCLIGGLRTLRGARTAAVPSASPKASFILQVRDALLGKVQLEPPIGHIFAGHFFPCRQRKHL
jgi:hypothetical protein